MQVVFTSVPLMCLCSLTSSLSPSNLLSLCLPLPLLSMSSALLCQGLFGGRTLGVSSRCGGERERHHLQRQGGDARPGAAVGEGPDGRPQPRLSDR